MSGLYFQIGADFDKLKQLKREIDDLKSKLLGMDRSADPRAFEALERRIRSLQTEYSNLGRQLSRYVADQNAANKATQDTASGLGTMHNMLLKIGGTTAIIGLGKQVIDVRNQFQQLEIAFGTMLKSEEKASVLMKDLTKFAAETPFGLQSAASGAKQLLAYGSTADTVIKELTMIGDVAAGTGQQIGDLVYLYGTLRTQGRAYLMDIRQFAGRGIPIYDELAKVLNVSKDKVNDFVSAGKVGFKEVEQAFKNMTSQGGLYGGLMEQQSASIGGRIEALKDNIDSIFNTIGKDSEGIIYKSIDGLNSLVENYEKVGKVILELVATYGAYKAAVILLTTIENIRYQSALAQMAGMTRMQAIMDVLRAKTEALNVTMAKNPYVIVGVAVAALGYGLYKLYTYQTEAEKAQSRLNETTKEYESNIESEKVKLDILFGKLRSAKEGTDKYKEAKQAILNMADSYHLSISKDIDLVKEETKYRNILNAAIIETAKAKAIESGTQKATEIYTKQWGDGISEIRDRFIKKFGESQGELLLDSLKESLSSGTELTKEVKSAIGRFSEIYYGSSATGGGSTTLNPVQQLVNNIQISKKTLDKEVKDLEGVFGKLRKTEDEDNKVVDPFKTYSEQIENTRKKVSDLKTEFNNLQKGIKPKSLKDGEQFDFAKGIEDKAKELKEAEDKLSYLLTGQSSSGAGKSEKSAETAAEKARKAAQKTVDDQLKLNNDKSKALLDARNVQLENDQKLLDLQEEGFDKQQKQIELNHQKELLSIEKRTQELIEKKQDEERKQWDLNNPNGSKTPFTPTTRSLSNLPASDQADLINADAIANKAKEKATEDLLKSILQKYQDYNTQRSEVNKQFDAEEKALTKSRNEYNADQIDAALAVIVKKRKEALKSISESEANETKKSSDLFIRLFTDSSQQSIEQIRKVIVETQALYNYLSTTKEEDITSNFGFTADQLKAFKGNAEELKAVLDGLISKKKDLAGRSEFDSFILGVKDGIAKIQKGGTKNIGQGITDIGAAATAMMPSIEKFGQDLGSIFGSDTADDISVITDLLGATVEVGTGVGKIMSGDIVGGIKDTVSGIAKVFNMANAANQRHREALKLIEAAAKAQEHAYQLALRMQSLAYEHGNTIFGDDPYGKAINGAIEYKNALIELDKSLKGDGKLNRKSIFEIPKKSDIAALENLQIVTGHKKTGLFGLGKGKDTYSGILEIYPELIDQNGEFNLELAKTVIAERKMSDENKIAFQTMIDNAEQAKEAYAVMKDYLTNIFGDLGDTMTDALVNSFLKGEDAAKAFYESASSMVQNLVKDMINAAVIAPIIKKATEDAMSIMEDTSLTDEQRMEKLMLVVDDILNKGLEAQDQAKGLYDYSNGKWKEITGKELFTNDSTSQSSTSGGFQTMSQDMGGELNGQFTALQMSGVNIEGNTLTISADLKLLLGQTLTISDSVKQSLAILDESRTIQINSYYELKNISKNTNELYQMNERLGNIEKNTKGLTSR